MTTFTPAQHQRTGLQLLDAVRAALAGEATSAEAIDVVETIRAAQQRFRFVLCELEAQYELTGAGRVAVECGDPRDDVGGAPA